MNTKNLFLLFCVLGFASFAFANFDVILQEVDANGNIIGTPTGSDHMCTFILYTKELLEAGGGVAAFAGVDSSYAGLIDNIGDIWVVPSYLNNLYRIVYYGTNCDCFVTVLQETGLKGKQKTYPTTTALANSADNKIDLDVCWRNKVQSLKVLCKVILD